MPPRTTYEKILADHLIGDDLLFIDLHLVHEVTSPQAFDGLRLAGRKVRRPDRTLATADHNVPTTAFALPIEDDLSRAQLDALDRNCAEFGIRCYGRGHRRQGIVHVIGPELGVTQPGMTIVCGDSHTSTHGAFGALAFGIGTSEVEQVLATQTLPHRRAPQLRVRFEGSPSRGVVAKDLILGLIGQIGTDGATGHVVEYTGDAIRALAMDGRMTISNMSIEAGARAGLIAPDETTFGYLEGRPGVQEPWEQALARWDAYRSDEGAAYDREVVVDVPSLAPQVSWGTNPGQVAPITGRVPEPRNETDTRALEYMGLRAGQALADVGCPTCAPPLT
jgi:3-isopropylmalate/(R)-2-methylmalate dehydratase large subunit